MKRGPLHRHGWGTPQLAGGKEDEETDGIGSERRKVFGWKRTVTSPPIPYAHKHKRIIIDAALDMSGMDVKITRFINSICTLLTNAKMVDQQFVINLVDATSEALPYKNAGNVPINTAISSHVSISGNNFRVFENFGLAISCDSPSPEWGHSKLGI